MNDARTLVGSNLPEDRYLIRRSGKVWDTKAQDYKERLPIDERHKTGAFYMLDQEGNGLRNKTFSQLNSYLILIKKN